MNLTATFDGAKLMFLHAKTKKTNHIEWCIDLTNLRLILAFLSETKTREWKNINEKFGKVTRVFM